MWKLFKRNDKGQVASLPSENTIVKLEKRLINRFVLVMQAYEKKLSSRQRVICFSLYFLFIVALCTSKLFKSFVFKTNNKAESHNSIVILPDISLPDSLNTEYLKNVIKSRNAVDSNYDYLTAPKK